MEIKRMVEPSERTRRVGRRSPIGHWRGARCGRLGAATHCGRRGLEDPNAVVAPGAESTGQLLGPPGHITANQMYVKYMVPQGGDGNVPEAMIDGMDPHR